jgi:hypothetical protein
MNTTNSNAIQDIVNKLPVTLFYEELPDRKQALKYITWLLSNITQSNNVDQDKLFREVISKELRIVSMKIIEIEILLMVALNKITLEDFTLDSTSLIKKIIAENPDKNDLDLMYRILAQIMTKLPMDLRDKVAGKHKLQIFQSVSKFINMEPKLLERFVSFNPSLNTPISMDLDAGDYNTLNKKYLDELAKFQQSQPYIDSNSMEYSKLANDMLSKSTTSIGSNLINGQYIDSSPDLMTGVNDNKLYYFDSSSGTISEFPISGNNQTAVSLNDLTNILSANKVDKGQIANLIQNLKTPSSTKSNIPFTTHPISFLNSLKSTLGISSSTSTVPTTGSLPNVASSLVAPVPPQFILSQSSAQQLQTQQQTQKQINPNDFINPSYYKQQGNSMFLINPNSIMQGTSPTYNPDPCTFPNPPPGCPPKKQSAEPGINDNLNRRFALRDSTYVNQPPVTTKQISHFSNMNSNSNSESEFIKKITKKNKDIENVAIAFVTVIILLFLLVIFNSIRNKSGLVVSKAK